MDELNTLCQQILKQINKYKKVSCIDWASGNFSVTLIKLFYFKKSKILFNKITHNIDLVNRKFSNLNLVYNIKTFRFNKEPAIIYENNQVDSIVYKQLKDINNYFNYVEIELKKILKAENK